MWKASGVSSEDHLPTTVYIDQLGNMFWRVVYVDQVDKTPREINAPDLTTALFRSFGEQF